MKLTGLHHVSAITANAAQNYDFYTRLLGLRLVKKTVNQDSTTSYHLFYGDEVGNPGTELTFFDIPYAAPTKAGTSSISRTALRVPSRQALDYWQDRFRQYDIPFESVRDEAGRAVLPFQDFEGQPLALVDDSDAPLQGGNPWQQSTTPQDVAIRGLSSVTLTVRNPEPTIRVLTDVMGFYEEVTYPADNPQREILVYATGVGGPGARVRIDVRSDLPGERLGRGGVHHVAFRVPDDEQHQAWVDRLMSAGLQISGIIDRYYFKSIYFREPNGILFELATDGPGFVTDEAAGSLGEKLALPPFLEPQRSYIEARLRPLDTAHKTTA